jgi:serine/threonine protein kinase
LENCHQIAEALDYANSKKVLHRDLKPKNIMVAFGEGGGSLEVKVLDFGLAARFVRV